MLGTLQRQQQQRRQQHTPLSPDQQQTVQQAMRVVCSLMQRAGCSDVQRWQGVIRSYSQLRCAQHAACAAAGEARPTARAQQAGSSKRGSGKCGAAEHVGGARSPPQLASLHELCASAIGGNASSKAADAAHLLWLEGLALQQLCSGEQHMAAVAQQLLHRLLAERPAPGDAAGAAQQQLVRGLLLLQDPLHQHAGGSSEAVHAAMAAACGSFAALLQLPGLPAAPSSSTAAAGAAGSTRGKAGASSSDSTSWSPAAASSGGDAAGAQLLLCAGLAHCWLAVCCVQLASQRHLARTSGDAEPGERAADAHDDGPQDAPHSAGHATAAQELFEDAHSQLERACALFEQCQQAAQPCWFAFEAMVGLLHACQLAASQAWHKGLQQRLHAALACAAAAASADMQQQVQQLSGAEAGGSTCSWLEQVVAPCIGELPATSSSTDAAAAPPAKGCSRAKGSSKQASPAAAEGAASAVWACSCSLQQHAEQLMALCERQGSPDLAQARLQLAAVQAAACCGGTARAAALAECAVQRARAALEQAAARGGGGSGPCAACGAAGWQAAQHATLGVYMSGLWLLSELLEAAGAPQDAMRLLKELAKLSTQSPCPHVAALAHASISCVHSRMGQGDKAAAAAAAASAWLACIVRPPQQQQQQQQQQQPAAGGASTLLHAYVVAAVQLAQAAKHSASTEHAAAQQQLQCGIDVLTASLCQEPPHAQHSMLRWRVVALRAKMQLRHSHCCLLLQQDGAAAVSQLLEDGLQQLGQATGRLLPCSR
jgi:tetratricopeptide (TPR) repeat protein